MSGVYGYGLKFLQTAPKPGKVRWVTVENDGEPNVVDGKFEIVVFGGVEVVEDTAGPNWGVAVVMFVGGACWVTVTSFWVISSVSPVGSKTTGEDPAPLEVQILPPYKTNLSFG